MALELEGPVDLALAAALQRYFRLLPVRISGDVTYNEDLHLNRILDIDGGLGEVTITIPATTEVGAGFAVTSASGSWPRIAMADAGSIRHREGHTRGLQEGVINVAVVRNIDGITPVALLLGDTRL